jgi:hypothetical protein
MQKIPHPESAISHLLNQPPGSKVQRSKVQRFPDADRWLLVAGQLPEAKSQQQKSAESQTSKP